MRLFGYDIEKIKNIENKSIPEISGISNNYVQTFIQAPLPISNSPVDLINKNTGYVYDCNKLNAQSVANVPYKLFTTKGTGRKALGDWVKTKALSKKDKELIKISNRNIKIKTAEDYVEIIEHPFLDLMYQANQKLDSFTLFEMTESYLGLVGNAYWLINRSKNGVPESIEVLPSEYISVLMDSDGQVTGYRYQVDMGGKPKEYSFEDVIHFKQPVCGSFKRNLQYQALTGVYGMGHLEGCIDEVNLLNAINKYEKTLMDNNCRPDYIIAYKGALKKEEQEKLSRQWFSLFRGRNQGKPALLTGDFDIKQLSFNPKDLAYLEGKKWLRTAIMNSFGIDESFFTVENANRASSTVAIEKYYRFTIIPKLRRIQEAINQKLLPMYDDNLFMQYDNPLSDDAELKLKQDESDITLGIRSINEIRGERGMDVIEIEKNKTNNPDRTDKTDNPITDINEVESGDKAGVTTSLTLNGAQITAALETISKLTLNEISPESATKLLIAVGLTKEDAESMVASEVKRRK